jgi:hypothetical protein
MPSLRTLRSAGAPLVALCSCLLPAAGALAQTAPAVVDATSQIFFRSNLGNSSSDWITVTASASLELGVGPGNSSVLVRSVHVGVPVLTAPIQMNGTVNFAVSGLLIDALTGPAVSIPVQSASPDLQFTAAGLSGGAAGTVNYSASGLSCSMIHSSGGVCSGPFSLAAPGANTSGQITSGSIAATPGADGSRAFAVTYYQSFPLVAGGSWGSLEVSARLRGTFPAAPASTCAADFNQVNGLTVQDIFDFLNAWFAGDPRTNFNHVGGLEVQDIFDFLNAWFAGCP